MTDVASTIFEVFEAQTSDEDKSEHALEEFNADLMPPSEIADVKLFGRWSCDDVHVSDMSLADYIAIKEKYARFMPHSAGRYAAKRFRKAQCPIVERLTNSLMMKGRNNGKKLISMRVVKHAFEIIYLLTDKNPLQVSFEWLITVFVKLVHARTTQTSIKLCGVENLDNINVLISNGYRSTKNFIELVRKPPDLH